MENTAATTKTGSYHSQPLKLYIQDIYRAQRTAENKYIYRLFDLDFKNVMIHGVVTSVYNTTTTTANLEISDPTGTIAIYFDGKKHNLYIPDNTLSQLNQRFNSKIRFGDSGMPILKSLKSGINKMAEKVSHFEEGTYISVVGDIFLDDVRNVRMVSAYECNVTSPERDIVWLEELKYLYEKYYLKEK